MENKELKVGDVVQLKSGSTLMTVVGSKENQLLCQWENRINGEMCKELFPPDSLVYVPKDREITVL